MTTRARFAARVLGLALLTACGPSAPDSDRAQPAAADTGSEPALVRAEQTLACAPMTGRMALDGRDSPYDSTAFRVGDLAAKVCYGRPSARGRTMLGGNLPYGQLWRTGANEPTIIHLSGPASIAGVQLAPGSYSIYTVPGEQEWTVILNPAIEQWGAEPAYTAEIEAREAGRGTAPATRLDEHVELFTIRAEPEGAAARLLLEWEHTRVAIPVRAGA